MAQRLPISAPFLVGAYNVPRPHRFLQPQGHARPLEIVGHCVKCGSPLYGYPVVAVNQLAPVHPSCTCLQGNGKDIRDLMQTK